MTATAYLDLPGLSRHPSADYAAALELGDPKWVADQHSRIDLLRRLRAGAGVTVYTGPEGAAFWQPVSIEVKVRVVPDGTDLDERCDPDIAWALGAVGLSETEAAILARRAKPPTVRHRAYDAWQRAEALLAAVQEPSPAVPVIVEAFHAEAVLDPAAQCALLDAVVRYAPLVALDWEWDIETQDPLGLAVATADRNWYLPVKAADYESGHGELLREAFARAVRSGTTVLHNAKADLQTQYAGDLLALSGRPINDTLVMAYLVGSHVTGPDLGLKPLTRALLGRDPMDYPKGRSFADLPLATAVRYAGGGDARNTYDLYGELRPLLRDQWSVYTDIERPVTPIIAGMERAGQPADPKAIRRLHDDFRAMEEAIRALWWAQEHLDIAKDKETRTLIERWVGYDPGSCAQDALAKITDPRMDSILAYRRIRHRRRAFLAKHLERWERAGLPDVLALRTSFNQAGGADPHDPRSFRRAPRSGRISSSGEAGNLQNQPGDIRAIFTGPPGTLFWALDYSGLEIRIAAARSQDPAMVATLAAGGDLHDDFRLRIAELTGVDVPRGVAKQGNFNAQYGGYADQLGSILAKQRAHLPRETLVAMADAHRTAYAVYHAYGERVVAEARGNGGYSETLWGRRRYDPDINAFDDRVRGHAERALINHTIQGTAADILKKAMVLAVPILRHFDAHLSLQVHDELAGWVTEEAAEPFIAAMRAVMESVRLPGLGLAVEGGVGRTWEDAK